MLSFFTTVSVLYLLYYTAVIGHDVLKNKDSSSAHSVAAVHLDFAVKHQPEEVTADIQDTVNDAGGEGKKNQPEAAAEKENREVQALKEGLMDAEELQNFLNDLNIEFIQPDFSLAKPVNRQNLNEDAQPVA